MITLAYDETTGFESIQKDPIKKIVTDISFNLFITNPIQFIEAILHIWCYNFFGFIFNINF